MAIPTPGHQIVMVAVTDIDPESTVNVRRSGIDDNREKLRASIAVNGYHGDQPVLLRNHPDEASPYSYECVSGRSRFLGAMDAGLDYVPSIIEDLDDEAAHLRSFNENEQRGAITDSDKIHWFNQRFQMLKSQGHTSSQAKKLTADHYRVSPATVTGYLLMIDLPPEIQEDLDRDIIKNAEGRAIARNFASIEDDEQRYQAMLAAAEWVKSLPTRDRPKAADAIKDADPGADVNALNESLDKIINAAIVPVHANIPSNLREKLDRLALSKGYTNGDLIIPMLISDAVEQSQST